MVTPSKGSFIPPAFELGQAQKILADYKWRYEHARLEIHKKALLRKVRKWQKEVERLSK